MRWSVTQGVERQKADPVAQARARVSVRHRGHGVTAGTHNRKGVYTPICVHMHVTSRPCPAALCPPITAPPLPACTCGRLRRAARALTQLYDDADGAVGAAGHAVLAAAHARARGLARASPTSPRAPLLDRTALSRTLDPLVERGLVADRAGPRRAHARGLADPRRATCARGAPSRTGGARRRRSRNALGAAKLDALIATLRRARDAASRPPAAATADRSSQEDPRCRPHSAAPTGARPPSSSSAAASS